MKVTVSIANSEGMEIVVFNETVQNDEELHQTFMVLEKTLWLSRQLSRFIELVGKRGE